MRNPYRQTTHYPLRGFLAVVIVMLAVMQVGMVVTMVDAITTPDASGTQSTPRLVLGCAGVLVLLLLEVRGLFFLTSGWEKLWDKPWKVLGQAVGNLLLGIVYAALSGLGHYLWGGTVEQMVIGVVGILILADLVGTGVVFMKVRKH